MCVYMSAIEKRRHKYDNNSDSKRNGDVEIIDVDIDTGLYAVLVHVV